MPPFASYPSLKDRAVFVSGGGSGIGASIVEHFAEQGAKVAFVDIDVASSNALVKKIAGAGHAEPAFAKCDVRDIAAYQAAIGALAGHVGAFTVLVNNAARDDRHSWKDVTSDYYDERIAVNLKHMFFATQAVASDMIEAGGGSIINLGSNSWWETAGGFPVYATAKAAVHGMTRTLARDLGRHRIRVNTIVPGWIMTERQKTLWATPEALERHRQKQCLPDLIEPVYIARMALFLASDDAAMCTANNYMVEAGSI
jgi:NAD(P)-dependent dehydrogenase (short-subunit alcohol dehydrogenase family)